MQIQILKAEKKEAIEDKKQATIQFVNAQKELNKIKNQIALENLKLEGDNNNLEILKLFELDLLKQTLFFTAQVDGEKVSPELLRDIKNWAEGEIENNHKKNDGNNGNTGSNGKSDSKGNKGNSGNSGSSNSGNSGSSNSENSGSSNSENSGSSNSENSGSGNSENSGSGNSENSGSGNSGKGKGN